MAAHEQLAFGTQFALNGGPLEFVLHPLVAYEGTAIVAALYQLAVQIALGVTLVWALRRSFPLLLSVPLAYLVLVLDADQFVPAPQPLIVLAFIWCMVALSDDAPPFAAPLVVFGGAVTSAVALLVQFSDGFGVLFASLVVVIVLQRRDRRALPAFLGVLVLTAAVIWLATGQGFGNVMPFARTTFESLSQWSAAYPYDSEQAVAWILPFLLAAIAAAMLAAWLGSRELDRTRRAAVLLIAAAFCFTAWKHTVVINHPSYAALFASLMVTPWVAFRWSGSLRYLALGAIAALSILFFPVSGESPSELAHPIKRAGEARHQLEALLLPDHRAEARENAKRLMRATYRLDPATLDAMRGRTVMVFPYEVGIAWAYDLDWELLPIPPYLAYTSRLDDLDRDAVEDPEGPELILRHRACGAVADEAHQACPPLDSFGPTYLPHEVPATTIAMACNFRRLRTTRRFQLLERTPDRCGRERKLGSVTAGEGEPVEVPEPPAPDALVVARVDGIQPSGLERLRTFLYRAAARYEQIDGGAPYQVVPGVMEDGLLLRVPPFLGSGPFPLAHDATTIALATESGFAASGGPYRIDFYAMTILPPR
jgi:hypothetical protein